MAFERDASLNFTLGFIFIHAPLEALFYEGRRASFFARWFLVAFLGQFCLVGLVVLVGCFAVQIVKFLVPSFRLGLWGLQAGRF